MTQHRLNPERVAKLWPMLYELGRRKRVSRGYQKHEPCDIDELKRRAISDRELMKHTTPWP